MRLNFINKFIKQQKIKHEQKLIEKRIRKLPKDYQYAYKKIYNFLLSYGKVQWNIEINYRVVDILETGVDQGICALDYLGGDVAVFCNRYILDDFKK